ncbi:nucleoid-associated protein YgaU [Crenobacter luteus]|uniref:Peptidoglycan-binding protein n=1 Tax=Crenobacter luteus TaxID=1452487 RepID=A0A163DKD1_9NEIS|nr:LysM peptidoglycan-binding domain-containing protein [Crenobacter luteus]KZE34847.1 peptidoglycan-binding protein [Crenobacter luteus]TCP15261.1 nucleoid-associated protein YgaU [Crenobacter luteus]
MRKTIISLLAALGLAAPAIADTLTLRPDAPSRYVVVRGDTLWGISGRYLKSPWQWPRLWQMNRDEVSNPHLIYPGEVLRLDYVNGQPRLSREGGTRTVKLSPRVRLEDADRALPSIPSRLIEPFLKRPLVIDAAQFARAPRLIAGPDERVVLGSGDKAYAAGLTEGGVWQAYRAGTPLVDPDTRETLGLEAVYGGDLEVLDLGRPGEAQTLRVGTVSEEIQVGDRLVQAPKDTFVNYAPRAPEGDIRGKVIAVYNGVAEAGQYQNLVVNRGRRDGVEVGHVFAVFKKGGAVRVAGVDGGQAETLRLPTEVAGTLFVYRVFDRVAYALVMQSPVAINVGDAFGPPRD